MSTLMQANTQWASRPADERFLNLLDLNEHTRRMHSQSAAKVVSSRSLTAVPFGDDHKGLQIVGPNGHPVGVSNFAFTQLSSLAGAPSGYLRGLPSELAADNLNYGLQVNRDMADVGLLLTRGSDNQVALRAATGPAYGRVWNSTITQALVDRFGDGLTGDFRIPGEFGQRVDITKDNTTLYAGDRDMFVFLADEKHRIELPNRRDGKTGELSRGFFIWNSEVGSSTFGVATFLFDYVCSNRIVWGAEGYKEIRIRHTATAPDRWIEEVAPALETYARSSTASITEAIEKARNTKVDKIDDFLKKRFTGKQITAIKEAHMTDEDRPMENLWDISTGITAYARSINYQDDRVKLEREAGLILDMA